MLRALTASAVMLVVAGFTPAWPTPDAGDDLETCRDRQADAKVRLDACEKLIAAGQASGKDLALAFAVRGNALIDQARLRQAIVAYGAAHDADPDNVGHPDSRGRAYEQKGEDELAMADYNLALQKSPHAALALNNRGTIFLRQGALQSALDDFNAALKINPNQYYAHNNRGHVLMINKDFEGALAEFAEADRIDPAAIGHNHRCQTYAALRQVRRGPR